MKVLSHCRAKSLGAASWNGVLDQMVASAPTSRCGVRPSSRRPEHVWMDKWLLTPLECICAQFPLHCRLLCFSVRSRHTALSSSAARFRHHRTAMARSSRPVIDLGKRCRPSRPRDSSCTHEFSRILKYLHERRLIERQRSNTDMRLALIMISRDGLRLVDELRPFAEGIYAEIASRYGGSRIERLMVLLRQLNTELEDSASIALDRAVRAPGDRQ